MLGPALRGTLAGSLVLVAATVAPAQDFRVYTRIGEAPASLRAKSGSEPSRTTTLFHAGKVYDRIDAGNQMTVFEPAQQRFVILDDSRRVRTVVSFDEIEERLRQAERRAREKLPELGRSARASDREAAAAAAFQLQPRFAEQFREPTLQLSSRWLNYSVQCETLDTPERVEAYLAYADWAARLNFFIDPRSPLPQPRLALNDALRRRGLLPMSVTRTGNKAQSGIVAVHRYDWQLDGDDREVIRFWETLLRDRNVRQVSLEEFLRPPATARR